MINATKLISFIKLIFFSIILILIYELGNKKIIVVLLLLIFMTFISNYLTGYLKKEFYKNSFYKKDISCIKDRMNILSIFIILIDINIINIIYIIISIAIELLMSEIKLYCYNENEKSMIEICKIKKLLQMISIILIIIVNMIYKNLYLMLFGELIIVFVTINSIFALYKYINIANRILSNVKKIYIYKKR